MGWRNDGSASLLPSPTTLSQLMLVNDEESVTPLDLYMSRKPVQSSLVEGEEQQSAWKTNYRERSSSNKKKTPMFLRGSRTEDMRATECGSEFGFLTILIILLI